MLCSSLTLITFCCPATLSFSTCTAHVQYILYTHTKIPIIIKMEGRSGKDAVEKRQREKKRRNLFHCSEGRLHKAVVESWLCLLQNGLHEVRQSLHSVYRSFEQGLQRRLVLLQLPQVATEGLICLSVGGRRWGAINRAKKRKREGDMNLTDMAITLFSFHGEKA